MNKSNTIIYINFSPYENAGKILDYLLSRFTTVILFSFQFHKIDDSHSSDCITVYSNKKIAHTFPLIHVPVLSTLTFYLLPIRASLIMMQIFYWSIRLYWKYKRIDVFFSVNAYTAWLGNILKTFGVVDRTVFWVWDYYPITHENFIVQFMRWIYWQFDKTATHSSTKTIFLNRRLETLRKKMNIIPQESKYDVIPIGTNPIKLSGKKTDKTVRFIFFGVVKKSQGLDLFFMSLETLRKKYPSIELHVIGGGPDKQYFENLSKKYPIRSKFYGYLTDDAQVKKIIGSCDIGLAPYIPEKSNVSHYSDPSKIKAYISLGVPVITTNVFTFSSEIQRHKAGVVVKYADVSAFIRAVDVILHRLSAYQTSAFVLSKKYEYNSLYKLLFGKV